MFYCADNGDDIATLPKYYESIDLIDAYHEQTILAYALNDQPLPVAHGAPVRLRAERQLGYKQAKYVMRIEAVDTFAHIAGGNGGFWEDIAGYEWMREFEWRSAFGRPLLLVRRFRPWRDIGDEIPGIADA